jgi:hypothetical protein
MFLQNIRSVYVAICMLSFICLTIIKPIPETVEAMGNKMLRRSKIEPRINCGLVSFVVNVEV